MDEFLHNITVTTARVYGHDERVNHSFVGEYLKQNKNATWY
jgi:hypothetical protein